MLQENPSSSLTVNTNGMLTYTTDDYLEFCIYLENSCGIILGDNKSYLVECRLKSLMKEQKISNLGELIRQVIGGNNRKLEKSVIDAMTTNETSWFRDDYPFEFLRSTVLPFTVKKPNSPLRIWSAACSYGHEPYSIAIVIEEFLSKNPGCLSAGVEILGTDISSKALEYSMNGVYNQLETRRGLSEQRRKRFFSEVTDGQRVNDKVRRHISFRKLNLIQGAYPLGKFDVIFCRNVLIYFSNKKKVEILANLVRYLAPAGYLFLGASEPMASYSDKFHMLPCDKGVVYQLKN